MSYPLINPNWHVILIHYPLGLLGVGVVIELLSFLWPRSSVRVAGRWMMLLGALASIPAAAAGLYAFRDVVSPQPIDDQSKWHDVVQTSPWTEAQWDAMNSHIWLAASGVVLSVIAVLIWLASSNHAREKLHIPALIVVVIALGLLGSAAWYAGETIYVHGTAVEAVVARTTSAPASAPAHQRGEYAVSRPEQGFLDPYIPPLQLHVLMAGLTVACALGALAATTRRRTQEILIPPVSPPPVPLEVERPIVGTVAPYTPVRLWLLATLVGIGTALAGLWFTGDWRLNALREPIHNPSARHEMQRISTHVVCGVSIVLLILLLAACTRYKFLTRLLATLLLLAVVVQMWLGILMLYDSNSGPLTGFAMS